MLGRATPRRSVARATFQDCSPAQLTSIEAALKQALADLDTAITALSANPLGAVAQDGLWLAFRGLPSDADAVKEKLTAIKTGLGSATIECEDPSSFGYSVVCGDEGVGYGSHGTPSDMATLAAKYAGGGLTLVQSKGTSTIDLGADDVKMPRFFLFGAPPASGFKYRWIIVDSSDRRYLMTAPSGESVFEYSDEYSAIVPKKTRALLRERGITSAEVRCRVLIPEIGDRLFTLPVTFSG